MRGAGILGSWANLLLLSLATTGLTVLDASFSSPAVIAGVLLILSGLKARIILADYLELRHSSFWMRLFSTIIGLFLIASFVLYALGMGRAG